jgi:hypothetical protein
VAIKGSEKTAKSADKALLTAARRRSRKGIEAAIQNGASVSARDQHGQTALHLVATKHDLDLAIFMVRLGFDPWAGSYMEGISPPISFFGDDGGALAKAAADVGIIPADQEPFAVLYAQPAVGYASFDSSFLGLPSGAEWMSLVKAMRNGEPIGARWPQAVRAACMEDETGKLFDAVEAGEFILISEPLAKIMPVDEVELLPITLLDAEGNSRPEPYFLLHGLAVDALDLTRCYPKYNMINKKSIDDVAAYVLRRDAVKERSIFRVVHKSYTIFVTRSFATELAKWGGVKIGMIRR